MGRVDQVCGLFTRSLTSPRGLGGPIVPFVDTRNSRSYALI